MPVEHGSDTINHATDRRGKGDEPVNTHAAGLVSMSVYLALAGIAIATHARAADSASGAASTALRNSSLPTDQRVHDLISHMTLEEKAKQLGHTAPAIPRLG